MPKIKLVEIYIYKQPYFPIKIMHFFCLVSPYLGSSHVYTGSVGMVFVTIDPVYIHIDKSSNGHIATMHCQDIK